MSMPRSIVIAACLLATLACSPERSELDIGGGWVGSTTTAGDVTTVVTESGSVWSGKAELIEEASIGLESGPEEYMFGRVTGVYASNEYVYVVDQQLPRVRQYTHDGAYVRDLGREGQGPGEYQYPGLVMGDGERVFVQAHFARRFNVYAESGEALGTWPAPQFVCCAFPMVATPDGFLRVLISSAAPDGPAFEIQLHGPDGPMGTKVEVEEIPHDEPTFEFEFRTAGIQEVGTPFSPRFWVNLAPSGAVVAGASDRYRFEVRSPGGSGLVVERYWEPVPVTADEAEWTRRLHIAALRGLAASPEWTWDGAEMPATKPAFQELVPTPSGGIWVIRPGPGERLIDCVQDPIEAGIEAARAAPCWRDTPILDAFDAEGRYLGEIANFPRVGFAAATVSIRGDRVFAAVEDDAGTIMVKRFRLKLPGEAR
jgi:hypothetical protein